MLLLQEAGALKEELPQYIASLDSNRQRKKQAITGQGIYMITPCNFFIYDIIDQVLDTGSLYHICNSLQGLQVSRRFEQGQRFLNVGDGRSVPVLALEILKLIFESHTVVLSDYHFYPSFLLNIISIGLLAMNNYEILIKK